MSTRRKAAVVLIAVWCVAATPVPTPYLQILPKPPQDLSSRNASPEELAKFAWQEFLALNWKASVDAQHPPSASNPRGLPDLTWNHGQAVPQSNDKPLVWQTYAQTTELRPNGPLTVPWQSLTAPNYSYANKPLQQKNGTASFKLWNNLDEDNEIGSCDIYDHFTTQKGVKELVLFQVKVNRDEYEYIRTSYGPTQHIGPPATPANAPCPNGAVLCNAQASVVANIAKPPYAYYPGATSTCKCPPDKAICLPCGLQAPQNSGIAAVEGAIEVKSAWRRLRAGEKASRFFTTTVLYYDTDPSGKIIYYKNATFALVAMHIIHKTTNFPDFVFATFEQVDVEQSDAWFIPLAKSGSGAEVPPAVKIKRQTTQTNRQQLHPVPKLLDTVTAKVRAQLTALNPTTVWQYYRLTGVSGKSIDCPVNLKGQPVSTSNCINKQTSTQCTSLEPNYYMANFMVESDPLLNNFSGTGFANTIFGSKDGKTGGCQNTVYANNIYNNGGCKGCHGVAQSAFGTDFSFLLDFGNNKPSMQPATIHYVPPAVAAAKPLKHFLEMMKR